MVDAPCDRAAARCRPSTAGPKRRAPARRQRDDPIGQQDCLVHVVGDQQDRLLARAPRSARSRPAASRASARRARRAARPSAASPDPSPARAPPPRAAACRPTARDGFLSRAGARFTIATCLLGVLALLRRASSSGTPASTASMHVLEHGQPRQQRVVLEHHAAVGPGLRDRLAVERHACPCRARATPRSSRPAWSCPRPRSRRSRRTRRARPSG